MVTSKEFEEIIEKIKNETEREVNFFYFHFPKMDTKQWSEFSSALAQNRSLQSLTFQNTTFPEDNIKLFTDALIDNQSLNTLCIHSGDLGLLREHNMKLFINVLVQKKSLRKLSLHYNLLNRLNESNRKLFTDALSNHPSITNLNLAYNNLGILGSNIKFFANAIMNKSLHFLSLENNQLALLGENNKFLTDALAQNQSIESLDFSCNDLGALKENISLFTNILVQNQSLTNLTLLYNNLGTLGRNIQFLAEGLSNHPSLLVLDLNCNNLGSLGENIKPLANAIMLNQSITTLSLANNKLHDLHENLKLLANVFMQNRTISTLSLTGNHLGKLSGYLEETFNFLIEALTQNPSITSLNLSENDLDERKEKVEILIKMFHSRFLTSLFLYENNLNYDANDDANGCHLGPNNERYSFNVKSFADALAQNQSLTTLELDGNSFCEFNSIEKEELKTALCQNRTLQNLSIGLQNPYDAVIEARIKKNKSIVHNVKGTVVLIAFARANRGHPFAASVLPLIPKITELSNYQFKP